MPKHKENIKYLGEIDTSKVNFLDFSLTKQDKQYLYNSGKQTAEALLEKFEKDRDIFAKSGLAAFQRFFDYRG